MLPGLNRLVERLVYAVPQMANVIFLTAFVIAAFAIIGMQLFCDKTPGRCSLSDEVRLRAALLRRACPCLLSHCLPLPMATHWATGGLGGGGAPVSC